MNIRLLSKKVWFWAFLAVGLILAIGVFSLLSKPKPDSILSATVTKGDIENVVLATGTLEPFVLVDVGSRASGQVIDLKVEVGQNIKKGDLIALLDDKGQTNELLSSQARQNDARAQKISAEASLSQALSEYQRQKQLIAVDATSKADMEAAKKALALAKASLSSNQAQIEQAAISVKNARNTLGYTRISAPIDGTILAVVTKAGQTLNAVQQAPTIVKMGQLDRMTVKAEISEADVVNLKPDMPVYFTILGDPERRYQARLRSIEPAPTTFTTTNTTTATTASAIYYYGLFDVDNPDGRLRTSMTANITIVLEQAKDVLILPVSALGRKLGPNRYEVSRLGPKDEWQTLEVTTGLNDGGRIQILSGLTLKDRLRIGSHEGAKKAGFSLVPKRPEGVEPPSGSPEAAMEGR
jgi:membrane fusion protein, macrolide-specific efflux system